jgi:hypothetical protein
MVWFDGRVGGGFKTKDLDTISLSALKADDGTFYKSVAVPLTFPFALAFLTSLHVVFVSSLEL